VIVSPNLPAASTFALGTIAWGTSLRGDDLDRLYDAFRAAGGNIFDSAHVYAFWVPDGLGASERALGEIVRRRRDRRNVILATKGGHPNIDKGYPRPDRYLAPEVIRRDIAESLERLGVDAIDLYFLHRDDPRVPAGEIIDLLNEHIDLGHLRAIGASNWTTARIAAANDYAAATGKRGFIASQVKFSLAAANPSTDPTVPNFAATEQSWHAATRLPVCAYSSTAQGFFATAGERGASAWSNPTTLARLRMAQQLARELDVTANQVALAYLLHQPFPVIPILGTTKLDHLTDALTASSIKLAAEQVARLRSPP
jgi:aryl-alcohol dehydrogenase-like predicted oxidoreductase